MMSPAPQYYDPSYNSPVSEFDYQIQYHQHLSNYLQTGCNSKEDEELEIIAKWQ